MTEAQARAAGFTEEQIAQLTLSSGAHNTPASGHCLLEVVSMFAGEPFSDKPACVDPILAEFGRSWNDGMRSDAEREQLKRYIPMLPGTAGSDALSQKRGWMAADWAIRVHTPAWLDLTPALAEHAAKLRALAPITSEQRLVDAQVALDLARSAADATRAAAWAAWGATRAAAWAAAQRGESPHAAADAVLQPTVEKLQASAHDLYVAMINAQLEEAAALDRVDGISA